MIDVTSLSESEYIFILVGQLMLIVFLVLRLWRLALYIMLQRLTGLKNITMVKILRRI